MEFAIDITGTATLGFKFQNLFHKAFHSTMKASFQKNIGKWMLVLECERKGFVAELSSCPTLWF